MRVYRHSASHLNVVANAYQVRLVAPLAGGDEAVFAYGHAKMTGILLGRGDGTPVEQPYPAEDVFQFTHICRYFINRSYPDCDA